MERLVFYQNGKKYHVKRKPPSDFLINVGFARCLIPFDTRMKRVFKQVFSMSVSEETNYELIEDFFISKVFSALNLTPAEFDRIIFQHSKEASFVGTQSNKSLYNRIVNQQKTPPRQQS